MKDNAMEAVMSIDPESGEQIPMQIKLYTDKDIERANLKPVTNPIPFNQGSIPTEDGLFSIEIFGQTPQERQRQFAYIDLKRKFFHPYVYEVLKTLDRKIEKVAAGRGYWHIDKKGSLVEIVSDTDSRYNEENTGLGWLIDNYHNIVFKSTSANTRKDKLKFLSLLSDDEIFISKFLVIPVFYRDATEKNGRMAVSDIDKIYNRLISYTNGLDSNPFDFLNNQLLFNIQLGLIELRKLGGDLIRGKHGVLHKSILGKSIDRGSRDVISQVVLNNCERPEDNPIDMLHTGVPLAKCLVLGYDFVLKNITDFFENNFKNKKEYPVYKYVNGKYEYSHSIPIKNQLLIYTKSYIDKKMKEYINTPTSRFDILYVYPEQENAKPIPMYLTGRFTNLDTTAVEAGTISRRPLTWTDVFYIAAMETLSDKYIYTTRFPITSYNSIFPSLCYPMSTINTIPAYVNGKFYDRYPLVDLNAPDEKLATMFLDTLCMSDLFLSAIGGDFIRYLFEVAYRSNSIQEKFGERITSGVCYKLVG